MRRIRMGVLALALSGGSGCSEPKQPAKPPPPPTSSLVKVGKSFASVPRGTLGPYLARRADGALTLWAYGQDEVGWLARALDSKGRPEGPVRRVAESAATPALVSLDSFRDGYLAVWSGTTAEGPILSTLALANDGRLSGPPQSLPPPQTAPIWLDIVQTPEGGLVLWGERTRDGAVLLVRAVDAGGAASSDEVEIPGAVRAWQVASTGQGAVLAIVGAERALRLVSLSARGEVRGEHPVPGLERVNSEVDIVRSGDRLIFATSAPSPFESRVFTGVAGLDGAPTSPPRPAVRAFGEQRLLRLVAGKERAFLAWQDITQAREWIEVVTLSGDGTGGTEILKLPWDGITPEPEFDTAGDDLRALAWACVESVDCSEPKVPVQLDFGPDLVPTRVNPWLADERVPDMAWNLDCEKDGCLGLAALFGDASDVYAVGAQTTPGQFSLPAFVEAHERPRVTELRAEVETLALADFDAIRQSAGTLVGWLSYFDPAEPYVVPKTPAPDGRLAPVRAQLWTQWIPSDASRNGTELPAANVVSYRAHSPGGVALSRGAKGNLIVWSAIDGKTPQVFTTLIDDQGKKIAQQMLSRQKGDIQQVMAIPSEDGWFVGWIDDRSGRPRSVVTRLGARLERKIGDQLLGSDKTTATGASLLQVGAELWNATANAYGEGLGRIELTRLDVRGLKVVSEQALTNEEVNDHSPSLVTVGNQVVLVFIRQAASGSLLHLLQLDSQGAPVGEPLPVETQHDVVGFAVDCGRERCGIFATSESEETQYLEAADFDAKDAGASRIVATIGASSALTVAPLLRGEQGWVYDLGLRGEPRLSRTLVEF